jgi:hypothetical protein
MCLELTESNLPLPRSRSLSCVVNGYPEASGKVVGIPAYPRSETKAPLLLECHSEGRTSDGRTSVQATVVTS